MKKALAVTLLMVVLLTGCRQASTAELPSPTLTPASEPTPRLPVATEKYSVPTLPVTPSPTVPPTPSPTPTPTPTPSPTPTPTPIPTPFTLVWMSDTQNISRNNPEVFNAMRDWILDNREVENILFVAHTGDVVDGIGQAMFDNAADALVPVFEAIPGMIASGNHDCSSGEKMWAFTNRPYAKLVQKEGQTYQNGAAAYATFRGGDTDFLVFGIGFNVVCPAWMNQVIAEHPDHVVIVVVHRGLEPNGTLAIETKSMFKNVMPQNPNFRLVLCGHQRGAMTRTEWFDDDGDGEKERSVTTMMFNYQDDRIKGLGFMRLLRFDPLDRSIEVLTYSPWFDRWGYEKAADEENHFVLKNAW